MKYPCLVKEAFCTTPISLTVHAEGLDENGGPVIAFKKTMFCNYQDTAKTVLTADKKLIQLSGVALFPGDIAPDLPTLSGGTAIIHGVERTIFKGAKVRNPDGTVNYTRIDLI